MLSRSPVFKVCVKTGQSMLSNCEWVEDESNQLQNKVIYRANSSQIFTTKPHNTPTTFAPLSTRLNTQTTDVKMSLSSVSTPLTITTISYI